MIAPFGFGLIVVGFLALCCAVAIGTEWLARRWRRNRSMNWRVR